MAGKGNPKGSNGGGGRRAGTPNKATADIKAIASQYSEEAVKTLVSVMRDAEAPHAARVTAVKEILDRAHGRSKQAIDLEAQVTVRKTLADFYGEIEAGNT